MTSVDLGGGILSVAASAFSDCDKLSELKVPDSVRTLGEKSFYGCDLLESVTLGAAVDSIGEGAFASCVSLKSFALNQRLSAIDVYKRQAHTPSWGFQIGTNPFSHARRHGQSRFVPRRSGY